MVLDRDTWNNLTVCKRMNNVEVNFIVIKFIILLHGVNTRLERTIS